jgi:acyl carrier protein
MSESADIEIEQKIRRILISELSVDPVKLAASNSTTPLLGRGIGLDSMETLALVAGIEKEFDIQVDDADLTVELFKNLATLVEYVLRRLSDRGAGP